MSLHVSETVAIKIAVKSDAVSALCLNYMISVSCYFDMFDVRCLFIELSQNFIRMDKKKQHRQSGVNLSLCIV